MHSKGNFIDNLTELNICPISISYEYDPCDFLKAKEMQQKRDNPDFRKAPEDDLINMQTGVMGYKGKVVYEVTGNINRELRVIAAQTINKNEQITLVAEAIDKRIHSNYTIFPCNKIAFDYYREEKRFDTEYTEEEEKDFEKYLDFQMAKIELENKDEEFLRSKLIEMYANPLRNKMETYPDLSFDGD